MLDTGETENTSQNNTFIELIANVTAYFKGLKKMAFRNNGIFTHLLFIP